jgi:hypothetical protein
MKTPELETRLRLTAAFSAAPRSIVDDVMREIGSTLPDAAPRWRWRRPAIAAGIAALGGMAAAVAFVLFVSGPVRLTLADVQGAFERQRWVHLHFDTGDIKDQWTDLQTGESYITRADGDAVYLNHQTNTRLWYMKRNAVIEQEAPTIYLNGQKPSRWTPQTAWGTLVAPLARVAATQPARQSPPPVVAMKDVLNGMPAIRFDVYLTDATGHRFLYSQLWADPKTRLPLREKFRLQLADREQYGREWSTGDYDFPTTGPADLYALGVPRGTSIHRAVTIAAQAIEPILAGVARAHDRFLQNYRAVVWRLPHSPEMPVSGFDVIWRDGQRLRDDNFAPSYAGNDRLQILASDATPQALLAWAARHEALQKQLMATDADYFWSSPLITRGTKPAVHVTHRWRISLLAKHAWPDEIQWPIWDYAPDFQVLDRGTDTPPGCVGLRQGGDGNWRADYYIDPANDYICVREVAWSKRQGTWAKTSQTTLSGLHRVSGRVVADTQTAIHYDGSAEGIEEYTETTKIQLDVVSPADYPPHVFDPTSLTTGATVEGY